MLMEPPYEHTSVAVWVRHGIEAIKTEFEGVHVPTVAGTHGIGVSTPSAAAVAEETAGLAIDVHIPQGVIFTRGAAS